MDFRYPRAFQRLLPLALTAGILLFGLTGSGCQTAYYETMEKLGYHKRDLMVSDVKKARDAQQDAKEQFKSALDRFTKTLNVQDRVDEQEMPVICFRQMAGRTPATIRRSLFPWRQ